MEVIIVGRKKSANPPLPQPQKKKAGWKEERRRRKSDIIISLNHCFEIVCAVLLYIGSGINTCIEGYLPVINEIYSHQIICYYLNPWFLFTFECDLFHSVFFFTYLECVI